MTEALLQDRVEFVKLLLDHSYVNLARYMSPKVLRALYYRGLEQEVQQPGDNSFFQQLVQNKLKLNQDILSAIQEKVMCHTSGLTDIISGLMELFRLLLVIAKKELIITNSLISYIIVRRNCLCRIGKVYISVKSFFILVKRKTTQDSFHPLLPYVSVRRGIYHVTVLVSVWTRMKTNLSSLSSTRSLLLVPIISSNRNGKNALGRRGRWDDLCDCCITSLSVSNSGHNGHALESLMVKKYRQRK